MIIRTDGPSLVLITQPDHARLARRMMSHFVARDFAHADRRDAILHAVEEHDNGWREVDAAPIVGEDGRLLDFVSAPLDVRQSIWAGAARRLAADPIAAALVAQHAIYIYRRFRDDRAWRTFFSDMERIRGEFAAGAGLTPADIARDYFFLRIADLMSLVFCTGWTDPQVMDDHVVRLNGERLIVRPDPFAGATVRLEIPGRRMPSRPFKSADEAASAFRTAPRITLTGCAVGG